MKKNRAINGILVAFALSIAATRAGQLSWGASPNAAIPDNQPNQGLLSTISIAANDSQLSGINPIVQQLLGIHLNITGGWNGDYIITLTHQTPNLQTEGYVVLLNRIGQNGAHPLGYSNAGMNDVRVAAGSPDIHSNGGSYVSTSPLTGTYGPDGGVTFGSFVGTTPAGDWSLYLTDNSVGDQGTLTSWTLDLDVLQAVPEPAEWGIISAVLLLAICGFRARCQRRAAPIL